MTTSNNPQIQLSLQKFNSLTIGGDVALLGQVMRNMFRAVPTDAISRLAEMVNDLDVNNAPKIADVAKSLCARAEQAVGVGAAVPQSLRGGLQALGEFSESISNFIAASPEEKVNLGVGVRARWDSLEYAIESNWVA